ncbi:hypothetical protein SCB49_10727 [unidentified eubacterium SCB49]|nr:hypothetical protein SCB49_10727 [unidentified eubacterium SCB49]
MKNLALLLLLLISVTACKNESDKNNVVPQVKETTMEDLSWVLGEWININDQTQSYEYWEKSADGSFVSQSLTLRKTDTVFAERMKMYKENDEILLYIETIGDVPNPVVFSLKQDAEHAFTFENPRNEFPSQIVYTNPETDLLHAWVAGFVDGVPQKQEFYYKRAQ